MQNILIKTISILLLVGTILALIGLGSTSGILLAIYFNMGWMTHNLIPFSAILVCGLYGLLIGFFLEKYVKK